MSFDVISLCISVLPLKKNSLDYLYPMRWSCFDNALRIHLKFAADTFTIIKSENKQDALRRLDNQFNLIYFTLESRERYRIKKFWNIL